MKEGKRSVQWSVLFELFPSAKPIVCFVFSIPSLINLLLNPMVWLRRIINLRPCKTNGQFYNKKRGCGQAMTKRRKINFYKESYCV